ncbi:MAG: sulfatase [Opitutales bacterium]
MSPITTKMAVLAACTICLCNAGMGEESPSRPNVLFISIDDLNDVPSFMGTYDGAVTPNMDRLASQGVAFLNAHVQYPVCGPSRASVMTGMLPTTLGYATHPKDDRVQKRALELGGDTIPSHFKKSGYKIMAAGKLFHRHLPKGTYHESNGRGGWGGYPDGKKSYPFPGTGTDWGVTHQKESEMSDTRATEWAIQKLQESHEGPFMLMLGFIRPHVPWLAPQPYFDLYPDPDLIPLMPYKADDLDDVPDLSQKYNINTAMPKTDWLQKTNNWTPMMHAYLASTSYTDYHIGRVLDTLEKSHYADNTIIVLWSDHGYHLGEKGTTQKHSLWERSSNVPFIIAGPGIQTAVSKRAVGLIDLFPTLAELCDLETLDTWEGRSLVPLLEDPDREWNAPTITSWLGSNFAAQRDHYRYIRYHDGSEELYDHSTDPHEWTNLSHLEEYGALKAELSSAFPEIDNTPEKEVNAFIKKIARYKERHNSL